MKPLYIYYNRRSAYVSLTPTLSYIYFQQPLGINWKLKCFINTNRAFYLPQQPIYWLLWVFHESAADVNRLRSCPIRMCHTEYFSDRRKAHAGELSRAPTWNDSCSYVLCICCCVDSLHWSTRARTQMHTNANTTLPWRFNCTRQQQQWTRSSFCASDKQTKEIIHYFINV